MSAARSGRANGSSRCRTARGCTRATAATGPWVASGHRSRSGERVAGSRKRLAELLTLALAGRYSVRAQLPFALSDDSEPEPDIAVTDRTSPEAHPSSAHLIVEVAETSLNLDLVHKTPRYASAGVAEYWVVDLPAQQVVVHQDPTPGAYRQIRRVGRDSTLTVLGVSVRLSDFLPEI